MTVPSSACRRFDQCCVVAFPLTNRVGRIREVAWKLTRKSHAAAAFYARQVTDGLAAHLERLGVDETERDRQIDSFWLQVHREIALLVRCDERPGEGL